MTNESKALAALKPCPFCGGEPEFVFAPYSKRGAVRCSVCLSEARENVDGRARGVWENAEDAIAIWNRRAIKSQFTDVHGVEEMADALESASKVPMDRIEWERLAVIALESQPVAGHVGEALEEAMHALSHGSGYIGGHEFQARAPASKTRMRMDAAIERVKAAIVLLRSAQQPQAPAVEVLGKRIEALKLICRYAGVPEVVVETFMGFESPNEEDFVKALLTSKVGQ